MMKKIEIDRVDYDVKPCPFCGRVEGLRVTERQSYEKLYEENGGACITMICCFCNADMYEHSVKERDYHKKVRVLVDKWNRRGGNHEGTEKCECDCSK